jgi:hypothetical protein
VRFRQQLFVALVLFGLLCAITPAAFGQSSDQSLPTPVLANEINGRITALDLGDARLTHHFYAFEGTPGDLLITIDGKNLNGDMDIFTAVTFRPLMKTSIYANSQAGAVTKGIYLRARQILILRVEARTPNDDAGSYRIRFSGSFEPFSGGIPVAENAEPRDTRPSRGGKRLSSAGATIAEPAVTPPVVAGPKPTSENEKPAEDTTAAKKSTAAKPANARTTRSNRNSRGRARPAPPKPAPSTSDTEAAKTSAAKPSEAKTDEAKKEAGAGEEKSAADSAKSETPAKPNAQEAPLPGAHLIIESKDGTKIDRPMSTVRRVVVEGGMIVIVLKTGKIERIPMSAVARMAIEP